jgi:hypothetical protein
LYFVYIQNPSLYQQLVVGGQPCWVQTSTAHLPIDGSGLGSSAQPVCWYDPSNTNDGSLATASVRRSADGPVVRKER